MFLMARRWSVGHLDLCAGQAPQSDTATGKTASMCRADWIRTLIGILFESCNLEGRKQCISQGLCGVLSVWSEGADRQVRVDGQ